MICWAHDIIETICPAEIRLCCALSRYVTCSSWHSLPLCHIYSHMLYTVSHSINLPGSFSYHFIFFNLVFSPVLSPFPCRTEQQCLVARQNLIHTVRPLRIQNFQWPWYQWMLYTVQIVDHWWYYNQNLTHSSLSETCSHILQIAAKCSSFSVLGEGRAHLEHLWHTWIWITNKEPIKFTTVILTRWSAK